MKRLALFLICCIWTPAFSQTPVQMVILGDSLTEGLGVSAEQAFPAILEKELQAKGHPEVHVVNAGISGSTSASGVSRLRWHLQKNPDIVLIALGANDGLRGLPLLQTRKNISAIITLAKSHHMKVLLAGMKLPPNYGRNYSEGFESMYRDLAREYHVPLIPFLLEGVAGERALNGEDGIHPNPQGHARIAHTILPYVLKLL